MTIESSLNNDLWNMYEEDDFLEFIDMMDQRTAILKDEPCPSCGYKSLVPISTHESMCDNCEKTFNI